MLGGGVSREPRSAPWGKRGRMRYGSNLKQTVPGRCLRVSQPTGRNPQSLSIDRPLFMSVLARDPVWGSSPPRSRVQQRTASTPHLQSFGATAPNLPNTKPTQTIGKENPRTAYGTTTLEHVWKTSVCIKVQRKQLFFCFVLFVCAGLGVPGDGFSVLAVVACHRSYYH